MRGNESTSGAPQTHDQQHPQRRPGDRRLPHSGKGAPRLRPLRPWQYSASSMRCTSAQSDIKTISVHHETVAGFMADVYYRVSGQPTATFTSCGPGSANLPITLANAFLELRAFPGRDREYSHEPVQPRRIPGTLSSSPGGFSVDRACLLQARVSADTRRDGAAGRAPGMEDDGHRPSGPVVLECRSTSSRKRPPRKRQAGGVERQHFLPLRR